jgi:CBS domain-containing protein
MKVAVLLDRSGYAGQVVETVIDAVSRYEDIKIIFMYMVKGITKAIQEEGDGFLRKARDRGINASLDLVEYDSIRNATRYICEKAGEIGAVSIFIPNVMEEVYEQILLKCSGIAIEMISVFPQVMEVMTGDPVTATPETSVLEISKIIAEKKIGCVIITNENFPVGIVTKSDLVSKVLARDEYPRHLKAHEIMSAPVITISAGEDITQTSKTMASKKIKKLPVVVDGILVGIITVTDLAIKYPSIAEGLMSNMSEKKVEGFMEEWRSDYDYL